ncbi:hypothetical protein AB0L40_03820 [Patulibacter sp. NPDC049589]|uniref:hypothetical protein n=1 Tax=Patulibacter sp. NPDC049589 TaxID=3154731 RepID=UPI00343E5900
MLRLLPPAALAALVLAGCGGDDSRPPTATVAATDPASVTCRDYPTPRRETCESSYFACREDRAEIIDDIDRGSRPDRRTISVAYAKSYWGDWDEDTRAAARKGCLRALPR